MDTVFNVMSGHIWVGEQTYFGHGCQVLTGQHRFHEGERAGLTDAGFAEIPDSGNDIWIGRGCWIASGAIITQGVAVGDNAIVGAGAVVTRDVPAGHIAVGVPATSRPQN